MHIYIYILNKFLEIQQGEVNKLEFSIRKIGLGTLTNFKQTLNELLYEKNFSECIQQTLNKLQYIYIYTLKNILSKPKDR